MFKQSVFFLLLLNSYFSIFTLSCFAQAPNWVWAKNSTGSQSDGRGSAITTDVFGNIYVAGTFDSHTITFGSFTLTSSASSSNNQAFLVKYDLNGNVLWARSSNSQGATEPSSVITDAAGNIYVTGSFWYTDVTFGSITLTNAGSAEIFIVKYSPNGNVIWAKRAGGSGSDAAFSVKVDHTGNILIAGYFESNSISFGSVTLTNVSSPSDADMFLAKYDANGNIIWAKSAGGSDGENAYSLAVDVTGNVYVTGVFSSPFFTIGNDTLTNADNSGMTLDIFLAKYDINGNVHWARKCGGTSYDFVSSISVDNSGNIFLAAYYNSPIFAIDSISITNSDLQYKNIILVKYGANGNSQWAKSTGGFYNDYTNSIVNDNLGNTYLSVGIYDSASFGLFIVNSGSYIIKYDNSGNVLWVKRNGGIDNTIDGSGNIYVTGCTWNDTIHFDSIILTNPNPGNFIVYTAKLSNFALNTNNTDVSCYGGSDGTATANAVGESPPYTYSWNTIPAQTTQTVTGLQAGTYIVTATGANGIYTIAYATINQPTLIQSNIQDVICKGDSFLLGNHFYYTTGIYHDTLISVNGCDSIINLSLIVDPLDTTMLLHNICQGSNYNFYNTLLTTAGTYYHILISSHGCDSVVSVHLTVNPMYNTNNLQTICNGNVYVLNGHTYSTAGIYIDTLISTFGCDSIITTYLSVKPVFYTNNPQSICDGSTYSFNGHIYSLEGEYNDTLNSILGCDSIIKTQLAVNSSFYLNNLKTICSGDSFVFNGHAYTGTGNYFDSLTTINGCDSVIELSLFVAPLDTIQQSLEICQGGSFDFYGTSLTTEGMYYHTLISSYGCDSVIKVKLNINPLPVVEAGNDQKIFVGNSAQLNAVGGVSYQWSPSDFLNYSNISNPISTPLRDITYIVTITDNNGCAETDTVKIFVEPFSIWVPNVFSPSNPNTLNQKLYLRGDGVKELLFVVYNRWGEKVYETNDISQGWDGTYKGRQLSSAVFEYYVKAIFYNGEQVEKKGDFTLLR